MAEVLYWVVAHPLVSVLAMIAVPVSAVLINAWRSTGPAESTQRESAQREPAQREPAQREPAQREPAQREPAQVSSPEAAPSSAVEPTATVEAPTATVEEEEPAPELDSPVEPPPEPVHLPLRERLSLTSQGLVGRLGGLLGGRKVDSELLSELETLLFTADLGVRTAESLLQTVREKASGLDAEAVRDVLRGAILDKLLRVEPAELRFAAEGPTVILVLGVNGSGKTTSIGKLAARYVREGKRVILGAGDTFRAAATPQLQIWGDRVGCEVVAGQPGGDPTSVAFDTMQAARARGADVAIVDTAGRLQTKKPLMEELGKMSRVLGREIPGAPHQTLLVLDANTGQNAISQARLFTEVTKVTDLVLTKLDGTAKGGVIVGLADEFGIPVRYVGVGETIDDLRNFDAREFVEALFDER